MKINRKINVMIFKTLVEDNFMLSYTKTRYTKFEEDACFLFEGCIKTEKDKNLAAQFIGNALGDSTFAHFARFQRPIKDGSNKNFSSAVLDENFDILPTPPFNEG